jgi:hypothetical protein
MKASRLLRDTMRPDPPGAVEARLRHRAACEQLERERAERFPNPSFEQIDEMLAWQERRLRELTEAQP